MLRWSVDRFRIVNLQIGPGNTVAPQGLNHLPNTQDLDVATLGLDLNSVPTERAIPSVDQSALLDEAQERAFSQLAETSIQLKGL